MPPEDPRCPECGEPVSATASYCLHCYADLEGSGDETVESAVVDFDGRSAPAEETPREPRGDAVGEQDAGRRLDPGETAPDPKADPTGPEPDDRRWFHPDSLLDDVSTGAVGIVAGLVVGFLAMVLALVATESAVGFLVWPAGWVGVGLYVGWTRSVFGAVRKACYLTAPTLVAFPLFWFGGAVEGGDFAGRVVVFVVTELVALPVALLLVGIGYWIGGKAPD